MNQTSTKILFSFLVFFSPFVIHSETRSLYWESIHVDAYLDSAGSLSIEETQEIKFDGDWNGAYRIFDLGLGQKISIQEVLRKDASGNWQRLTEGDIDFKDHFEFDRMENKIKWRSRDISEPPFSNTLIVYKIKVLYTNILKKKSNGVYVLDHDFSFSDREGDIKKMSVSLNLHKDWKVEGNQLEGLSSTQLNGLINFVSSEPLYPGEKMIVNLDFSYLGNTPEILPGSMFKQYLPRFLLYLLLLVCLGLINYLIYRYSKKLGLMDDPTFIQSWDQFKSILGKARPEHIALLSETGLVGSWMTRLILEKKIEVGKTQNGVLKLRQLIPFSEFSDNDQQILKSLFVNESTEVTAEDIKSYYKSKKASYSLFEDIQREYQKDLESLGFVESKTSVIDKIFIFFTKKIFKYDFALFFTLVFFVAAGVNLYHNFLIDFLEPNGIGPGRLIGSLFFALLSVLLISVLEDVHYGFTDLTLYRKRYFISRFLRSLVPSLILVCFYFWSLELSDTLIYISITMMGFFSLQHLFRHSPYIHKLQIQSSLNALALKNYLHSKILSSEPCDIPVEYSAFIPAFDLESSLKFRQSNLKLSDALYLYPESQVKSNDINVKRVSTSLGGIHTTGSMGISSSSGADSSTFSGGGGLSGGAGASASWSDMSDFSSTSSYTPPSSGSSSGGSGSSGGGGGGGW